MLQCNPTSPLSMSNVWSVSHPNITLPHIGLPHSCPVNLRPTPVARNPLLFFLNFHEANKLKVHNIFPKVSFPPWLNFCKQTNWLHEIPYETGGSPTATLSHWGQASSRKQSECGRHSLSNILKLQVTFLSSIYHQRAGKSNFFHMRGGRFHAGNTLCILLNVSVDPVKTSSD